MALLGSVVLGTTCTEEAEIVKRGTETVKCGTDIVKYGTETVKQGTRAMTVSMHMPAVNVEQYLNETGLREKETRIIFLSSQSLL